MGKRRDRHGRGMRGPLAGPAPERTGLAAARHRRPPRAATRAESFYQAVTDAVARVQRTCPEALAGIEVGLEEVPGSPTMDGRVPLATAVDGTAALPPRVVLYRRPIEHRSMTRRGMSILTHRTLVEQLSALTGRSIQDIDPQVTDEDDD